MDQKFKNIKVLIWDIDGTLYKHDPRLWEDIIHACYHVITIHTGWSKEKVKEEFHKIYKSKFTSTTQATAFLSQKSVAQIAIEVEKYKDRSKYVAYDQRLVDMFGRLKQFTHYMLVNGIQETTRKTLHLLGIPESTFTEIVTSEIVGENKPSPKGFAYILQKTGLPPEQHLMLGDRIDVDLVPAKKLGMKTCLVWSDDKSDVPHCVLKEVYDIADILL